MSVGLAGAVIEETGGGLDLFCLVISTVGVSHSSPPCPITSGYVSTNRTTRAFLVPASRAVRTLLQAQALGMAWRVDRQGIRISGSARDIKL